MPLAIFLLLVILIATFGFWGTLEAILGGVLLVILLLLLAAAVVALVVRSLLNRAGGRSAPP